MKKIIYIISLQIIASNLFSQIYPHEKADYSFIHYQYHDAIQQYEKLIEKKHNDLYAYRIAHSYFKIRNYRNAYNWFQKILNEKNIPSEWLIEYGHSARMNNELDKAKTLYIQYIEKGGEHHKQATIFKNNIVYAQNRHERNIDWKVKDGFTLLKSLYLGGYVNSDNFIYSTTSNSNDKYPSYAMCVTKNFNWETISGTENVTDAIITPYYIMAYSATKNNTWIAISKNYTNQTTKIKQKKLNKFSVASDGINKLGIYFIQNGFEHSNDTVQFEYNSIEYNNTHPFLTNNGNALYFCSDMPGGIGGYDIYVSYQKNGAWSIPQNLGAHINTIGDEMYPFILNDTVLYFSSNGREGFGGADIYFSKLIENKTSDVKNMGPEFNSVADDFGLVINDTGEKGMFFSNRDSEPGRDKMYSFEKIIHYVSCSGKVTDKLTNIPIPGVSVKIYHSDTIVAQKITNIEGEYNFEKFHPKLSYRIVFEKEKYQDAEKSQISIIECDAALNKLDEKLEPTIEKGMIFTFNDILFDYDKANLLKESEVVLERLADFLKKNNTTKVELSAHTDCRGNDNYNMKLSQRRAESCVKFLISSVVQSEQLIAKGYGESKLKNKCDDGIKCSEDEHQINRRVEIKVLEVK